MTQDASGPALYWQTQLCDTMSDATFGKLFIHAHPGESFMAQDHANAAGLSAVALPLHGQSRRQLCC